MNFGFSIKEGTRFFFKGGVSSLAGFSTFAIGFSIIGLFGMITYNVFKFKSVVTKRFQVVAFLEDEADERLVEEKIKNLEGVSQVRYISKEKALMEVKEMLGKEKEVLDILEENPLPKSIRINLSESWLEEENFKALYEKLRLIPGVEDVWIPEDILLRLKHILNLLLWGNIGVFLFITISVMLLVFTITKSTVATRIAEYDLIHRLGGSPGTAKAPFVIEGMLYSIFGTVFAYVLVFLLYKLIALTFKGIEFPLPWLLLIIPFGVVLGFLGSMLAVESFPLRKE